MIEGGLGVTFSTGVVTFSRPPELVEEVVAQADATMYEVQNGGKDNIT